MNEDIIKCAGLLIPLDKYKNTEEYIRIKDFLTRRTKDYNSETYTTNKFFIESNNYLTIPRNFPLNEYIHSPDIKNNTHDGEDINITHSIIPRNQVQFDSIDYLMSNDDGILQLLPGVGKTVISIYMIAERKKRSIILVHKNGLADQWRERLLTFTDLKEIDVSRLTSKTYEDDLTKSVIIATVQTFLSLIKRKYSEFLTALYKANIGVFIADEVHTSVGAPTFSQCSIYIPAKYTYGLSATPYRADGNEDIIKYHLGEVFKSDDTEGTMKPTVSLIFTDYGIDIPQKRKYLYWGGTFQRSRYLNQMIKSVIFISLIKNLLLKFKDDRKIICMLERIKLIDSLYDWIPAESKSKFCGSAKLDVLTKDITFTTPGKCRDGIDAPWKDCLIMTSPISNIEQVAGRITRTMEEKQSPIIIDMVDYGSKYISNSYFTRRKFYQEKGWNVQYLLYKDNELKNIDEQVAYELLI